MKYNINDNIFIGYIRDKNDSNVTSVLYYPAIIGKNIIGIEISTGCIFPLFKIDRDTAYENSYTGYGNTYIGSNKDFFEEIEYFLPLPYDFTYSKEGNDFRSVSLDNSFLRCIQDDGEIEHYLNKISDNKMDFITFLSKKNSVIRNVDINELDIQNKKIYSLLETSLNNRNQINKNNSKLREIASKIDKLNIGHNLNERNNLTKAIGREKEVLKLIKSVGIFNDSVILLGEPGVGKTTIVEDLALAINQKRYDFLEDKIIYSLNQGALVADTKYRGTFEEKLNMLFDVVKKSNNKIILFIDEIHMLYNLGNSEGNSATVINMLKPYIESGDITIIGATTPQEYMDTLANDKAFTSRCNIIKIKELSKDYNIEIIYNYILDLANKYNVEIKIDNIYQLSEELYNICLHQNVYEKILPLRIVKRIIKDAVANALISSRDFLDIDDIFNAIKETDEIVIRDYNEVESKLRSIVKTEKSKSKILIFNGG